MIQVAHGNLLEAEAEALVNTVNCVGRMGKGIALQFKQAFPDNFKAYERACRAGDVQPGRMFIYETRSMVGPKYIINFPTKRHWKERSRIEDIDSGLRALTAEVVRLGIASVAVPPLGCGLGGLSWGDIRPRIESAFESLPGVQVQLFEPAGAPPAEAMPVGTKPPKMTRSRALLIKLMQQYEGMTDRLTLLEIQKLAYFLQEAGEPLKLQYSAHTYGPYADNLNKALQAMEGHLTRGLGDSPIPDREISLLPGATDSADEFLSQEDQAVSRERLHRVANVIEGFETPYGMELLASVHWAARHGEPPATDVDAAIHAVHQWSSRKQKMFSPVHIAVAWDRLKESGCLRTEG